MTGRDDALSVREARARYFRESGFPPDGGYDATWVKLQLGPLAIPLLNTAARVRAVRLHDLHHVATGYATDWTGEAEIAAWEIAGGCADHHAAWLLNLEAMAIGLVIAPRRVWRAFRRGRRSRTLYREAWSDSLLALRVSELRARLGLADADPAPGPGPTGERAAFAGWCAAAAALALATLALLLAPVSGLAWLGLRALA